MIMIMIIPKEIGSIFFVEGFFLVRRFSSPEISWVNQVLSLLFFSAVQANNSCGNEDPDMGADGDS